MLLKKVAACLLAMLLFCSCSAEGAEETADALEENQPVISTQVENKTESIALVLAVGRNFAETNPLQLKDEASLAVLPLLYETLVTVDESYHWQPELAAEIEQDGLEYIITLKEAVFSDESPVRASDIVNSMNYAKEAGTPWSDELSIVEDCVTLTAQKVRITLSEPHPDFENLLTFPIIEEKNDGSWFGSGQYVLNSENADELFLEPNSTKNTPSLERIELKVLPNSDILYDSLKIGSISCIFDDLSSGEAMKLSERSEAVEIGHLLFLGVNGKEGIMSEAAVRRAIHGNLDRQLLVGRVYASKATAATTPFHPNYYRISNEKFSALSRDNAQKLLQDAGLTKNAEGFYSTEEQDSLKLLYNSENAYRLQAAELIQQQLENIFLKVELVGLPYEEYIAALKAGEFDLYLGEMEIDASMDLSRLFEYGYGCVQGNATQQVYQAYQQGSASAELFLSVYQQNLPMIPLLYRQGLVICKENVEGNILSNPVEAFASVQ